MPGKKTGDRQNRLPKRVITAQVQNEALVSNRRDLIIRAAITVFHRQGYHTSTTADIAAEAGMTQSNLYNYLKSKQDVLFLVCENLVEIYDRLIDEVCGRFDEPYTRVVEVLRQITRIMMTSRDEVQLLYNETHALAHEDRAFIMSRISHFIGRCQDLLKACKRESGVDDQVDGRLAANMMSFVPAISALRHWDLAAHNCEDDLEAVVEFILRGLGIYESRMC